MIRPEQEGSSEGGSLSDAGEPPAQDYWAYVQDDRERYPHLWRTVVRVHTRAFRLAYPDLTLRDVWKLGDVILRDVVETISAKTGDVNAQGAPNFHLQMPLFPTGREDPEFRGTWRGWLSVGEPERVY